MKETIPLKFTSMIILALILGLFTCSCKKKKETSVAAVGVRTSLPRYMRFQSRIRLQGNVEPKEYALICAKTDGTIDIMEVDEGDRVKPGQLLFQSDKLNLESELEVAKKALKVKQSQVREAEANYLLNKAKLDKAVTDFKRHRNLQEVEAISKDEFEKKELSLREALINLKIAKTTVNSAKTVVEQSESNLAIAKKYYDDSLVKAPFAAVVTNRYKEPGEYAKKAECILRLENPEKLEITLLLSSKYYSRIIPGKTKAVIHSETGKKLKETTVAYKSPTIDTDSRTFEIKINLKEKGSFVSGMLCNIDLILADEKGYGVPKEAVLIRGEDEAVVFTVKDGKAEEIPVKKGLSYRGYTEIKNFNKSNLAPVVVQGQAFLNSGAAVNIVNGKTAQK